MFIRSKIFIEYLMVKYFLEVFSIIEESYGQDW